MVGKRNKKAPVTSTKTARYNLSNYPSPTTQPPLVNSTFSVSIADVAMLGLLFFGLVTLYALATPRTVMLEDDGLFIAASAVAGVAHPPGYPLYIFLGWLISHIPLGSMAWRVHTLSGIMGAVSCCCIAWLVLRQTNNRLIACIAGVILAVSDHFWSQAIISDVYTTNSGVLLLTLVLVQEAATRNSLRLWILSAFIYGLGLANHWPLLILGSPILLFYAMPAHPRIWNLLPLLIVISTLTAALLYGWMVWRSHQDIPINFLGPIKSFGELIAYIRRDIYGDVDNSPNADWTDKWLYVQYFINQLFYLFTPLGAILALWGAFVAYRRWKIIFFGQLISFLTSSVLLIILLGFDYAHLYKSFFRPYPLISYCIFTIWFSYGLHALIQTKYLQEKLMPLVLYSLCCLMLSFMLFSNAKKNFRPKDTFATDRIENLFDMMDENAIFIIRGDTYVAPITYLHYVEGLRSDIRVLEHRGLVFSDRLYFYSVKRNKRQDILYKFLKNTQRPIYYLSVEHFTKQGVINAGFLHKVDKNIKNNTLTIEFNQKQKKYFKHLTTMPETQDAWITMARNEMINAYGRYIGFIKLSNKHEGNEFIKDIIPLAERHYSSLMGIIHTYINHGGETHTAEIERLFDKALEVSKDDRDKQHYGNEHYVNAIIHQAKGDLSQAILLLEKSIKVNQVNNPAYALLKKIKSQP